MRIPRLYTSQNIEPGQRLQLEERAAHYLGQVLRMKAGRQLRLFNGNGLEYPAVIEQADKRRLICQVDAPTQTADKDAPLAIELGIAISKGDRMDLVIQKATELGVTRISPLLTERVDVKLSGDRLEKKQQHWQQVMISACEQCGRNRLVELQNLQALHQWQSTVSAEKKLLLAPEASQTLDSTTSPKSVALLIGPEGGLDDSEIHLCLASGFNGLQLGPRVLRTETAPLAAISILQFVWGDMG